MKKGRKRERRQYLCPSCGKSSTNVTHTAAYNGCIIRRRECLLCGYTHETAEVPVEVSEHMRLAVKTLADNIATQAQMNVIKKKAG